MFSEVGKEVADILSKDINKNAKDFAKDIDKRIDIINCKIENLTINDNKVNMKDIDSRINVEGKIEINGTPMTDADRKNLKAETNWSDEIINSIQTKEEADILQKANVHEEDINGKKCLVRDDIDMDQKDDKGRTNRERMEQGLAPLDKNGDSITLHHIGQENDSPLAELTKNEHSKIPNPKQESQIDRQNFDKERAKHWETRSKD